MTKITDEDRQKLATALASATSGASKASRGTSSAPQQSGYPAPTVTEAPTGTLNPVLGTAGVEVVVAYPGMTTSDVIGLSFNGNDKFEPLNGSVFGKVTFNASAADVAKAIGKTVDVRYAVVRPDDILLSEPLKLTVTPIPENQLAGPQITQASAGALDVSALTADADVTVAPWPLIAAGQRLWLRLEGSSNLDLPAWQGFTITSAGAQSTKIPLNYLKSLTNGSSLKLLLEVSFDNGVYRQAFPLTTYTVKQEPDVKSIAITSVKDSKGNEIPNGGTTTDTTVTVSGTVTFAA